MKERSTSGGWEGGSNSDLKSGDCQALATMPEGAGRLNRRQISRQRLYIAKDSLAFAGYCWTDEYIEGPALQGRKGFFYIWLTPPGL